jgi:hypothetical protein
MTTFPQDRYISFKNGINVIFGGSARATQQSTKKTKTEEEIKAESKRIFL